MIELLDYRKQWSKIKAGFKTGNMFQRPPAQPNHPFKNGRDPLTEQAQMTSGMSGMPKGSVFTGKNFRVS